MPQSVVRYFENNWNNCVTEWVYCWQQQNLTFGQRTTNRLESVNRRIKAVLNLLNPLPLFFKDLITVIDCMRKERDHTFITAGERISVHSVLQNDVLKDFSQILTPYAQTFVASQFQEALDVNPIEENGHLTLEILGHQVLISEHRCQCIFFKSMALPCKHMFVARQVKHLPLFSYDGIGVRWLKAHAIENHRLFQHQNENLSHLGLGVVKERSLTQSEKFKKAYRLSQRLAQLVSESSNNEFEIRLSVLQNLAKVWEENKNIDVSILESPVDFLIETNLNHPAEIGKEILCDDIGKEMLCDGIKTFYPQNSPNSIDVDFKSNEIFNPIKINHMGVCNSLILNDSKSTDLSNQLVYSCFSKISIPQSVTKTDYLSNSSTEFEYKLHLQEQMIYSSPDLHLNNDRNELTIDQSLSLHESPTLENSNTIVRENLRTCDAVEASKNDSLNIHSINIKDLKFPPKIKSRGRPKVTEKKTAMGACRWKKKCLSYIDRSVAGKINVLLGGILIKGKVEDVTHAMQADVGDLELKPGNLPSAFLNEAASIHILKPYLTSLAWNSLKKAILQQKQLAIWNCPFCNLNTASSESIECESCLECVFNIIDAVFVDFDIFWFYISNHYITRLYVLKFIICKLTERMM
ncbi:uncharacterized protein LOC124812707 isoform X2 [Hydra vulgaris]|uniref:Uncharacterized protein LOC124812707 isoform X2 n=1 Tax=Hydra vulgaris TaxID=6087 RepID=A0ABM4B972_HYDVU